MSSIKVRLCAVAWARLEKEMAERAAAARKRKQRQAIIGSAIAVVVLVGAGVWIATALNHDDIKKTKSAASKPPAGTVACTWTPADSAGGAQVKDTGGTPPPNAPNTGKDTLTVQTNLGNIVAAVDRSKAPCTAAAFEFLSYS